MDADSQQQNKPSVQVFKKSAKIANLTLIVSLSSFLLFNWFTLAPFSQRRGIILCAVFVFWRFKGWCNVSYTLEVIQFILILLLNQRLETDEGVSHVQGFERIVDMAYCLVYIYYLTALGFLLFLMVLMLIYQHYVDQYIRPSGDQVEKNCIEGIEFESLKVVKFTAAKSCSQENCSICLAEYQEDEELVELPVCMHNFHKDCIKKWLEKRVECPYCRGDVRINIIRAKEEEKKDSMDNLDLESYDSKEAKQKKSLNINTSEEEASYIELLN